MKDLIIRDASDNDIESIAEIERLSFTNPWSKALLQSELKHQHSISRVLIYLNEIRGFYFARILFQECQLMDIAVHPGFRQMGFGSLLIDDLLKQCKQTMVKDIFLEVRKHSEAVKFYQKMGFVIFAHRKDYYTNPVDDALMMHKQLF